MTGICDQPVCDTTATPPIVPETVYTPTCGLPINGVWTNATIRTNANGCISEIENGEPLVYTPDPCCPEPSSGGSGGGLDGPPGPAGQSATVAVGTVNAGAPGTQPVVTNSGTPQAAVLNFTIPVGQPGVAGGSPTGLTTTANGYDIQSGLIQQLPTQWPPVLTFTPSLVTNNGITLQLAKSGSTVNVTLDASVLANSLSTSIATQAVSIAALTTDLSTAMVNIASLSTALSTAVSRIDAAGIP
jgi:hypothetical protein